MAGQDASKKKTIVAIGRRLAEIMYMILRNKNTYEVRQWKGVKDKMTIMVEHALTARRKGDGAG